MTDPTDCALAAFVYEVGYLKRLDRAGWGVAGVPGPVESVAEHSHRTGVLAHLIALGEGANADRAATLGLYHDVPETRIGDIPYLGRRYLTAADADKVVNEQTADLDELLARPIRGVIEEFEAQQTPEAVCARDADKIECLFQALEYRAAGATDLEAWISSSLVALRSETAKHLAHQALSTRPGQWWRNALDVD